MNPALAMLVGYVLGWACALASAAFGAWLAFRLKSPGQRFMAFPLQHDQDKPSVDDPLLGETGLNFLNPPTPESKKPPILDKDEQDLLDQKNADFREQLLRKQQVADYLKNNPGAAGGMDDE